VVTTGDSSRSRLTVVVSRGLGPCSQERHIDHSCRSKTLTRLAPECGRVLSDRHSRVASYALEPALELGQLEGRSGQPQPQTTLSDRKYRMNLKLSPLGLS
jgi:hypothetical protein